MDTDIYNNMVKRTVLYTVGLWFTLFSLWVFWSYYSYWEFSRIQEKKDLLLALSEDIGDLEKEWMLLNEFKSNWKKVAKEEKNLLSIIEVLDEEFFKNHFSNDTDSMYADFIDKKIKQVQEKESSEEYAKLEEISSTVLPSYIDSTIDIDWEEAFSELHFINYVERIMQTFNLEYTGDLWIGDILPIEEKGTTLNKNKNSKKTESLVNRIFYIPLSFTVSWSKWSIMDFIYFIENVWRVESSEGMLKVVESDFFEKSEDFSRSSRTILEWDIAKTWYNIFLNQIADIENIVFEEYVYEKRNGDEAGEFLKNIRKVPQGLEKYEIDITLNFYVKGLSEYKISKKYEEIAQSLIAYKANVSQAEKQLNAMKTSEKTPENYIILKRLVIYESYIKSVEEALKKQNTLETDKVYSDILNMLEVERKILADLQLVTNITKTNIVVDEEDTNNN